MAVRGQRWDRRQTCRYLQAVMRWKSLQSIKGIKCIYEGNIRKSHREKCKGDRSGRGVEKVKKEVKDELGKLKKEKKIWRNKSNVGRERKILGG